MSVCERSPLLLFHLFYFLYGFSVWHRRPHELGLYGKIWIIILGFYA